MLPQPNMFKYCLKTGKLILKGSHIVLMFLVNSFTAIFCSTHRSDPDPIYCIFISISGFHENINSDTKPSTLFNSVKKSRNKTGGIGEACTLVFR